MPQLVRLYIRNVAYGFVLSGIFVGLLLWFNVANLGHLVAASSGGYIALVMLFMFNGIVFAGVQFAIAVMRMADSGDKGPTLRQHSIPRVLRPVPVPVPARPKG